MYKRQDYVRVVFPEDTTTWMDASAPEEGEKIYVHISHDASGLMKVEGASAEKPGIGGDYTVSYTHLKGIREKNILYKKENLSARTDSLFV